MSGRGKQKQMGQRIQMGRGVKNLPVPSWEERRQAKAQRIRELEQENAKLEREIAEEKRRAADAVHAKDVENTAFLNIQAHGLDKEQGRKLINRLEAERRRWVRDRPRDPQSFPVFDRVKQIVAELKGTVAPVPKDANPLAPQLPPPLPPPRDAGAGARQPLHAEAPQTDEQIAAKRAYDDEYRTAYEAGRKLSEDEREQKRRYEEFLRKYGMSSTTINHVAGTGGLNGLGR